MRYIYIYIVFSFYFISFSQSESTLKTFDSTKDGSKVLSLKIADLSFIKNNEYFNLIADGYTLFGNKINSEIIYYPQQNYNLRTGVMLLKYYGKDIFSSVLPYFSLFIKNDNHTYYFGKLNNDDNHHLSRQIYDFERYLDNRSIENGIEHRYKNHFLEIDTWLEWEYFIQKYDENRERLNFGHFLKYQYVNNKWKFVIPFQFYLHHRGGQINKRIESTTILNNAIVITNIVVGFVGQIQIKRKNYLGIRFDSFYHFINSDNTEEFIFKEGKAYQWQFFYHKKYFQFNINYWQSDGFISPKGDDMFQSVSRRVNKYFDKKNQFVDIFSKYTEKNRKLLYVNFNYKKEIYKQLFLIFNTDIFYQINDSEIVTPVYVSKVQRQLDYSMGLFLIYKFNHHLLKL